jgi:hypothetical protein
MTGAAGATTTGHAVWLRMQPHGAQWKPNPQPLRTNVMDVVAGCSRTEEIGAACAPIGNDDASTPQRANDNLLNIDETPLLAGFLKHGVVLLETEAQANEFYQRAGRFAWVYFADL